MITKHNNNHHEISFLNKLTSENLYSDFILDNILTTELGVDTFNIQEVKLQNGQYYADISCNISDYIFKLNVQFKKVYYAESVQIYLNSVDNFKFIDPIKYTIKTFKYVVKLAKEQHLYASYLSSEIFIENLKKYKNLEVTYDFMGSANNLIVEHKQSKNALKLTISDNYIYVSNTDKRLTFLNYIGFTHLTNQDFVLNVLLDDLNDFGNIYNYKVEFLGGISLLDLNELINKFYSTSETTHDINIFEQTYQIRYKKELNYEANIRFDELSKQFVLNLYIFDVKKFFVYENLEDAYKFENKVFSTLYGG